MKKCVMAIAVAMATTLSMASLTDGLVGYWPFDGDAKDYSGNGNHGATHGVTLTADRNGNSGCAYHFGEGKYISVSSCSQLNAISDFTVSAWIKIESWDNEYWAPILCKGTSRSYGLEIEDEGAADMIGIADKNYKSCYEICYGDVNGLISTSHKISRGHWVHVAATRSNEKNHAYLNGIHIGSSNGITPARDSGELEIGRDPPDVIEYFHGAMDEMTLYNRALSSSEISALYNSGLKLCMILFNSNGGTGSMNELNTLSGKSLTLPANQFTRDGYIFLGWALSPDGEVIYREGEEIDVDSDMTLYAVWGNPALTLTAESADWSSGSITLRCEDADTSGATHRYSLFYRDSNTWAMIPVEGATNVVVGADGFAHLTDAGFASRQGGIGEIYYCATDENGRVSGVCTTRKRHALCVGVGHYEKAYQEEHGLTNLPNTPGYADAFASAARRLGGFSSPRILTEARAKRQALDDELENMAAKAKPGDICLFYIATHGYLAGAEGGVCLYDGDYTEKRLVGKVERFCEKGAALVAVLSACQSEALVQRSFANVGIIAVARAESYSDDFFDDFLIEYGWEKGWAGNGGTVSFGELAEYAKARYDALYWGITLVDESDGECFPMTMQAHIDNEGLLRRITAGSRGSHSAQAAPNAVSGIAASKGAYGNRIEVSWSEADYADGYLVFYGRGGTGTFMNSAPVESSINPSCYFNITDYPWMAASSVSSPVRFEVRAWNGAGVSVSSETEGWIDVESAATVPLDWLQTHHDIYEASEGNSAVAAAMTAANGCRTVGECFALGIDPEDPNDDFKIERFEMKDGKPVITLNHTEDGSGNSFATRIRTLGSKELGAAAQWDDVTDLQDYGAEQGYRFFKVDVELP